MYIKLPKTIIFELFQDPFQTIKSLANVALIPCGIYRHITHTLNIGYYLFSLLVRSLYLSYRKSVNYHSIIFATVVALR